MKFLFNRRVLALILLFCLCFYVLRDLAKKNEIFDELQEQNEPLRRKSILISTLYRAGSTFVGELFNRNLEIFYHFEPLTLFGYDKPNLDHKLALLEKILVNCETPNYSDFAKHAFNDTTTLNVCATENSCFWFNSRRFCEPPFCKKKYKDHADTCRRPCPGINLRTIESLFLNRKIFQAQLSNKNWQKKFALTRPLRQPQKLSESQTQKFSSIFFRSIQAKLTEKSSF